MKIEAAIFDIGNVLAPFDYERAFRRLAERSVRPGTAVDRAAVLAAREELELGRISRGEFLARVRLLFGHEGPEDEFVEIWQDIFEENPAINALVEALARHMPLYLLSNISCIHREYLQRAFPVFRHFRRGIYSYEAGMLKPDPALFRYAADTLSLEPTKTLYIDDMPENVEAARAAGFPTVQYDRRRHTDALAEIQAILGFDPFSKETASVQSQRLRLTM